MTRTSCPGSARTAIVIFTLLIWSILTIAPSSAATQYLADGPSFTATLSGNNEFVPGEEATISILVKNTGLNTMKQVGVGMIEREDQQNTAKTVTIGLASVGDAVIVKTDPQMVGDIRGGNSVTGQFNAKISPNATAGEYELPLILRYRYSRIIVHDATDIFEFTYNDEAEVTLPVTIRIQPPVKVDASEAVPEELPVGSEGNLTLKEINTGPENGTVAELPVSVIIPVIILGIIVVVIVFQIYRERREYL